MDTIEDTHTLETALPVILENLGAGIPVLLEGPPGLGKSQLTRHVAQLMSATSWHDFRASTREPVDLTGIPSTEGGLTVYSRPDFLPREDRDGQRPFLFLDEITQGNRAMQGALLGLVLDGEVAGHRLPPATLLMAACNAQADRAGANQITSALATRFAVLQLRADVECWAKWAYAAGVAPILIQFLRFRPALFFNMEGSDFKRFGNPRAWTRCSPFVGLKPGLRVKCFAANVGLDNAMQFEAFAESFGKIPTAAEIIADPGRAPIPSESEPGLLHAVSALLAAVSTENNFESIIKYTSRLPGDFETMAVMGATRANPKLKVNAGYIDWACRHSEVML